MRVAGRDKEDGTIPGTPLRLLFVPWDRFPPFRPAAKAIFLRELPKRGHRIDWLIQADEGRATGTLEIPSGFAYVGETDSGQRLFNRLRKHALNLWNSCRVFSLTGQTRYDLIQAKDNFGTALICAAVARLRGLPFFYWIAYPRVEAFLLEGKERISRYPLLYRIQGYFFKLVLYKMILPAARHIFVQSEQMMKDIAAMGVPYANMTPVPSSVDLDTIPYMAPRMSDKLMEKGTAKWVVYLGTLKRIRRLDFMIRSFAIVLKERPDAILLVIGKGDQDSDLQWLKEVAAQEGISDSVVFTGHVDMVEGWEYIRHADVCLSPYFPTPILLSTSPTKLVEYMAMAKPVVANDHPEQSLVIRESGAGLCTQWDEQEFATAILAVLADPQKAAEMGARGRAYIEQHRTNQIMGDLVERTYRRYTGEAG